MNTPQNEEPKPEREPITPQNITAEERRILAENTNRELLSYYEEKIPRVSEGIKLAARTGDGEELERLAKALRMHHAKLSEWNIAAGEHASGKLIAVEEYLESAARDLETVTARPIAEDDTTGEEWKNS